MWAAVYSLRHVLWYRIRRLDEESVERLIRLARASRPSARSQVGFIVDGVGIGAARAWDQLQREVAATPGVLLLGSVRTEDVFPLRTLPDCVTVNVVLDEAVAERIFQKLRASNRTDPAHWREAYVLADGLTLEYTYLLTRGRRLADVLEEQVKRRVEERRDTELQLIALAATAHRWDGSLSFDLLQDLVGIGTNDLRIALARLNDEHLLRTTGQRISGLHPLRSRFLSDSVHAFPPPTLTQTLQKLVANIDSDQVGALVAGVLTDRPELEIDVLDAVQERLIADPAPELLATVLDALRTVDFQRSSSAWPEIMDRHNVDPPLRHIAFQLAMLDGDTQLDLKPGMAGAIAELRPNLGDASPLGIRFVEQAGPARVSGILAHCSTTNTAVALLSAMSDSRFALTDFSEAAWTDSNVASLLRNASAVHFGNLIEAAGLVDIKLANLFFALGGGEQGAIAKLIQHSPWITDLRIVESESPPVAYVRTMHISDDLQGDPDQSNRDLARTMLRCFPMCGSVDAQALLPGGLPIRVGGFELAVSHLQRHYDHSDAEVSWNRRRISIAAAAFGTTNRTERVALAMKILQELAEYFGDLTRVWVTSRNRPADVSRLEGLRARLRDQKDLIVPLPASAFSKGLETAAFGNDYLHSLVDGLVDNLTNRLVEPGGNMASLAAFAGDSLRKFVTKIELQEEWELLDSAPSIDLARIDETLVDLHAVLSELAHGTTPSRDFTTAARSGRSDGALSRAADVARRAAQRRHTRIWEGTRAQLRAAGAIAQIYSRRHINASATEWPPTQVAIGLEVGSIQEWGTQAVEVIGLLAPGPDGPSYHPGILVVPFVEGRPLRQMCMQIISTALPDADSILSWTTELPPAHETPITDALFEAHKALQELSGLALLSTYRETEQLQSAADEATQRFSTAIRTIEDVEPQDAVMAAILEYLVGLETRIQGEMKATRAAMRIDDYVAVSITKGASGMLGNENGGSSEEFSLFNIAVGVCLQADVNRDVALALL